MKVTSYHRPTTLADARRVLKELGPSGLPLAGATSHVFMKGDDEKAAVDLAWLGYDRIHSDGGDFVVGANIRIADLQNFHAPGWVLDRVALHFVSQPIREMSTLGGNIARVFPWNDFPVALLALDAAMVIEGEIATPHSSQTFFKGQPARLFQPGDLLTEVRIPAVVQGSGFAYHKEKVVSMDFSALTLAVWMKLEKRTVAALRVAVGAGVPFPCRWPTLEQALTGRVISLESIHQAVANSVDDMRWKGGNGFSDPYIRQLALAHTEAVMLEAWQSAKGGAV